MDATRWAKVRVLFDQYVELPRTQRAAHLHRLRQEQPDIAADLERLLDADSQASTEGWAPLATEFAAEAIARQAKAEPAQPDKVGDWHLLRPLGEGGMGVVYLGERQGEGYRQRAAIKLLRLGHQGDPFRRRFHAEQAMLSSLQHPNIAHLIEGGISRDGQSYLALEYVDGIGLTQFAEDGKLAPAARIHLFIQVCSAVEHAHQRLIVHRDLKPGNILVSRAGQIKLLDFGIGKLLSDLDQDQLQTATGMRLFTLGYGAPEQLRGEAVSTATDVYALGAVLCELLTGELPYLVTSGSAVDWERQVLTQEPQLPSQRGRSSGEAGGASMTPGQRNLASMPKAWQGDLDAIILKALRREPELRYTTVAGMREDLNALLEGRPVSARKGSRRYRVGKFLRRHAVATGLFGFAVLALLLGSVLALWQASEARTARDRAELQRQEARLEARRAEATVEFLTNVFANADPGHADGDEPTARDLLAAGETELERATDLDAATRTSLTIAIARARTGLGDREATLRLMQQVQADAAASGSPSVLIDAKLNLGIAYNRTGRRSEALEQYQTAEDIYRLQRLDNPLLVARIDRLMAIELANLDRDAEALARIERAYQVLLAEGGPLSQELADCLDVYLVLLKALGRAAEGLIITAPSYDALSAARQLPTLRRAQIMASHAYALKLAGQAKAAEGAIRTSIALRESLFGADAVELTSSMSKLIAILRDQRRYDEAAALAERALAIRREHLPASHPSIAFAASNAARAWLEAGAAARGRPAIDEALAIYRQTGRLQTAAGLSAQLTRVEILRAVNDHAGADGALADLVSGQERLDPEDRRRLRELLGDKRNPP